MATSLVEDASQTGITLGIGLTLSYTKKGNFKLGRSKSAILLPSDMFASIFKGLESKFGSGAFTIAKLSGRSWDKLRPRNWLFPRLNENA